MLINLIKYFVAVSSFFLLCETTFSTGKYEVTLYPDNGGPVQYTSLQGTNGAKDFALDFIYSNCENSSIYELGCRGKRTEVKMTDEYGNALGKGEIALMCLVSNTISSTYKGFKGNYLKLPYQTQCDLAAIFSVMAFHLNDGNPKNYVIGELGRIGPDEVGRAIKLLHSQSKPLYTFSPQKATNWSTPESFILRDDADPIVVYEALSLLQNENNGHREEARNLLRILEGLGGIPMYQNLTKNTNPYSLSKIEREDS